METLPTRELVAVLQLLIERPKFVRRHAEVLVSSEAGERRVLVSIDHECGRWSVSDGSVVREGGPDRKMPDEAALLAPVNLPVWGRPYDTFAPREVEVVGADFRVLAYQRDRPEIVCEVLIDGARGVARSFSTPVDEFRLISSAPGS